MSLGIILILIVLFGFLSNWLNWKYLNYRITHYLYYVGAFVHESSHAVMCLLTGAKIQEFAVFSPQPHVTYLKSRIPIIGNTLISSAPIFGGLLFLYLINHFAFGGNFTVIVPALTWQSILLSPLKLLSQVNVLYLRGIIMLLLLVNIGAMIGPSFQDLKNMWPVLILLFFVKIPAILTLCLIALNLILASIFLQILIIFIVLIVRSGRSKLGSIA